MGAHKSLLFPNSEMRASLKSGDFNFSMFFPHVTSLVDATSSISLETALILGIFKGCCLMMNQMDMWGKMPVLKATVATKFMI